MEQRPGKQAEIWALVAYYAGLGFVLPGGLAVGYVLGWAVDRWLHTSPVFSVVAAAAGAVGGFIEVLRLLERAEKNAEQRNKNDGPRPG